MEKVKKVTGVFSNDSYTHSDELKHIIIKSGITSDMSAFFETETHLHIQKVALYADIIARNLDLDDNERLMIKKIAPLHDIGKLLIPAEILAKPSKLSAAEFDIIKSHANLGYEILKSSTHEVLKLASLIAFEHHEKFNGTGYPLGLKGEEIHLYSRIIALADVIESLGSDRCYKKAWSKEMILNFVIEQKNKHFDPDIVNAALKSFNEFF